MRIQLLPPTWIVVLALLTACGKTSETPKSESAPGAAAAAPAVKPTGNVITIHMIADEKGSRYEPAEIEAHDGDVLRFTLDVGVHNVHFLADSNPGVPNPPEASDMLQLPAQTYVYTVALAPGKTYYFQCDPHVALGMKGHLKVE
jgi:plastocyanin